jgi:hypothetical protein
MQLIMPRSLVRFSSLHSIFDQLWTATVEDPSCDTFNCSANTQRGVKRFVEEMIARVRRAGAIDKIVVRFDSGYLSNDTIEVLEAHSVSYTMAVHTADKTVARVIATIPESDWVTIDHTPDGQAGVAKTLYKG